MAEMDPSRLQAAHMHVASALGELAKHFTNDCRLTFVMRKPDNDECYLIVSDELDLGPVAETIVRHRRKEDGNG